jgi:hypothetical protein
MPGPPPISLKRRRSLPPEPPVEPEPAPPPKPQPKPRPPQNPPRVRKPPPPLAPDPVGPCRARVRPRWMGLGVDVRIAPWNSPFRIEAKSPWSRKACQVVWHGPGSPPEGFEPISCPNRREAQEAILGLYRAWLLDPARAELLARVRSELKGKVLLCWCGPKAACHASVLLELANAPEDVDHADGYG